MSRLAGMQPEGLGFLSPGQRPGNGSEENGSPKGCDIMNLSQPVGLKNFQNPTRGVAPG